MKEVLRQLRQFICNYKFVYWLILLIFCCISVYINYAYGLNEYIDTLPEWECFWAYFMLYAVHYLVAFVLYILWFNDKSVLSNLKLWVLIILGFAIFALRATYYGHAQLITYLSGEDTSRINRFVFNDLFRLMYLVVPVSIIWYFADRHYQVPYGISLKNHKPKLYWILLLCMIPLIVLASTQTDFLDYYPRYHKLEVFQPPQWKIWVYEICYGMDFISIEYFFRGFMVMAIGRYVGIHAILPMACFYMSIHYGKPMGEAISSFFGGSILGVISFYSRSIFGGIMVHAGIAWLMEIGGFIGNYFRYQ